MKSKKSPTLTNQLTDIAKALKGIEFQLSYKVTKDENFALLKLELSTLYKEVFTYYLKNVLLNLPGRINDQNDFDKVDKLLDEYADFKNSKLDDLRERLKIDLEIRPVKEGWNYGPFPGLSAAEISFGIQEKVDELDRNVTRIHDSTINARCKQ